MVTVVTCGILEHEVRKVLKGLDAEVRVLPGGLHMYPDMLRESLALELQGITDGCIIVVYGKCFKGIDEVCRRHGAVRVDGDTCYEIVAGDLFSRLLKEEPGTYFLLPQLCDQFESLTAALHMEEEKETYFRHYTRCVFLDTGTGLGDTCLKVAQTLGLPYEKIYVGTEILENRLMEALER
jgi:hypothetical protein